MFSILIVDDNKVDREGIHDLMDWHSLEIDSVELASDGREGAIKALSMKPDIVITDIDMPEMDGLNMLAKIRTELPQTSYLVMSCFDEFEYVQNAMKLDVGAYILKPIELDEMAREIRLVVSAKKRQIAEQSEIVELRQRITLSLPLLREQLIRDILGGRITDPADIHARAKYLDVVYRDGSFCVVYVRIDDSERVFAELGTEDKYLLVEGLRQCMVDSIGDPDRLYLLENQHNDIYGVVFTHHNDEKEVLNDAVESAEAIEAYAKNRLAVEVTVGISAVDQEIVTLPRLLDDAESAARSRFFTGGNRIILSSDVAPPSGKGTPPDFGELRSTVAAIIEQSPEEDIAKFVDDLFVSISDLSESEMKGTVSALVELIQLDLFELSHRYEGVVAATGSVWKLLNEFETVGDIRNWMTEILVSARSVVQNHNSSRYEKIISDVKAIVETNYASIANIEQIVDELDISAGYANLLFKKHTGETIFDFLVKTRVRAAEDLLKDPYARVYEVSEQVGYRSTSYFRAVFKSYTGMTPKQYTNTHAV